MSSDQSNSKTEENDIQFYRKVNYVNISHVFTNFKYFEPQ